MKWISIPIFFFALFHPLVISAQELVRDTQVTLRAKVVEVISQESRTVPGTDTVATYQELRAEILDGIEEGKIVTVENDYLELKVGDVFYAFHTTNSLDNLDVYTVSEPYRLPALYFLLALFVLAVLLFGGIQGIRGLVSLVGSLALIFYILLPGILHGYSPVLVSIATASVIIIFGSYVTHGFTRTTTAAVIGMISTVMLTGFFALWAINTTHLSGFSSEEAIYLNFDTRGQIDFVGLLLSGVLIGLLGVLYDAAIGQAISVEELSRAAPHLSRSAIYKRALRIGREHIGALVNTLAIAYVGASLPLLLLLYGSSAELSVTANRELFATEMVRTIIGSIGLILAVPITTTIAVWMLVGNKKEPLENSEVSRHHH